jgi:hypothetical protein
LVKYQIDDVIRSYACWGLERFPSNASVQNRRGTRAARASVAHQPTSIVGVTDQGGRHGATPSILPAHRLDRLPQVAQARTERCQWCDEFRCLLVLKSKAEQVVEALQEELRLGSRPCCYALLPLFEDLIWYSSLTLMKLCCCTERNARRIIRPV